jgi:hypothetical protein
MWSNFLSWRRAGVSAAAREMMTGVKSANTGVDFEAAMFSGSMNTTSQIAKCQDWYTWCTNNWVDTLCPMAYSSTAASIQSEITTTKTFAAGKRVVAGLYIDSTSGHPVIVDQLNAIKGVGVESFILFSGGTFAVTANQTATASWVTGTATIQKGDFDSDGYVDSRDRALLSATYTGTPVTVTTANRKYDLNADNVINAADVVLFNKYFAKFRFGEDGVVDQRDIDALRNCFGATAPVTGVQHLYDLDGDGDVDYADQVMLHGLLTVVIASDLDVDRNGRVNMDDLYAQLAAPIDVDRNGLINNADADVLRANLRALESQDLRTPRP